jgi:hypothetical protein
MSDFLPSGPWDARGNRITVNGQTVATVFYPRYASQIASEIAKLPDLMEEIERLKARIEELETTKDEEWDDLSDF